MPSLFNVTWCFPGRVWESLFHVGEWLIQQNGPDPLAAVLWQDCEEDELLDFKGEEREWLEVVDTAELQS